MYYQRPATCTVACKPILTGKYSEKWSRLFLCDFQITYCKRRPASCLPSRIENSGGSRKHANSITVHRSRYESVQVYRPYTRDV